MNLVYASPRGFSCASETLPGYLHRQSNDELIIAMPSAAGRRIRKVVTLLNQLRLRFEIVPSYE